MGKIFNSETKEEKRIVARFGSHPSFFVFPQIPYRHKTSRDLLGFCEPSPYPEISMFSVILPEIFYHHKNNLDILLQLELLGLEVPELFYQIGCLFERETRSYAESKEIYHDAKSLPVPMQYYTRALELSEDSFMEESIKLRLYRKLQSFYKNEEKKTEAKEYEQHAESLVSECNVYARRGDAAYSSNQKETALKSYKKAARIIPHADLYYNCGQIYAERGLYSMALSYYKKAFSSDTFGLTVELRYALLYKCAWAHLKLKHHTWAYHLFKDIASSIPDAHFLSVKAHYRYGNECFKRRQFLKAVISYKNARRCISNYYPADEEKSHVWQMLFLAKFRYANELYRQEKYEKAMKIYNDLLGKRYVPFLDKNLWLKRHSIPERVASARGEIFRKNIEKNKFVMGMFARQDSLDASVIRVSPTEAKAYQI